ncbi:MAG: heme peroxidase family protein [Rhodothalassiaceae bacterium]
MAHHHGMEPLKNMAAFCRRDHEQTREDRFGRMFPDLAPAYISPHTLRIIGAPRGPMDSGRRDRNASSVSAGMVIFGQFVDHDITLDVTSSFDRVNEPGEIGNVRTPTLDLDCIYGAGPEPQPYLYSQTAPFNGVKLLTGADMPDATPLQKQDLLRGPNGRAIIGDPRNDENGVIGQMQLAMIRFHNNMAQRLHDTEGLEGHDLYEEARRLTTWHYQWTVVNDFLVAMCGRAVVDRILGCGREYYCPKVPFIPVEFAVAAYRFGHSMVPMSLRVQENGDAHELFGSVLGEGFSPLSSEQAVVEWAALFETPGSQSFEPADRMDTLLASDLLALPFIGAGDERSLATRNLLRGNSFLLPGGDTVAEKMGRPHAEIERVMARIHAMSDGLIRKGAPLWLYLLAEAELIGKETQEGRFEQGEGLGPVGARIVAEVLIGLMELDERSYLGANRSFVPDEAFDTVGKILASTELAETELNGIRRERQPAE